MFYEADAAAGRIPPFPTSNLEIKHAYDQSGRDVSQEFYIHFDGKPACLSLIKKASREAHKSSLSVES